MFYISPNVVATHSTGDEKVSDDQILINDCWEQRESAVKTNSIVKQHAVESPAGALIKCPHCVYKSKYNKDVTRHIRTQHTHKDERRFKCGKCSYAGKRKDHLVSHEKTCKG
jgi:uncharacterized C2H2 Zn-finger protein